MQTYAPFAVSAALALSAAACASEHDAHDVGDSPTDAHGGTLIASVELPNGNALAFYSFDGDDVAVQERGRSDTNSIGMLAALEHATPYELFLAAAPVGAPVPDALVANHEAVLAARREAGITLPSMAPGFRIEDVEGLAQPADGDRYFNGCTDYDAWRDAGGTWTNCNPANFDFKTCEVNKRLSAYDNEDPSFIPFNYWITAHNRVQMSACYVSGGSSARFRAYSGPNWDNLSLWFDHTLSDPGDYYWHWYSSGTRKAFKRQLFRTGFSDSDRVNNSVWGYKW